MRYFELSNGTALDLEHVLAVSPILVKADAPQPFYFSVSFAFGTRLNIASVTREEAEQLRAELVSAWKEPMQTLPVQQVPHLQQVSPPIKEAPVFSAPLEVSQDQVSPVAAQVPSEDEVQAILKRHEMELKGQTGVSSLNTGSPQSSLANGKEQYMSPFL